MEMPRKDTPLTGAYIECALAVERAESKVLRAQFPAYVDVSHTEGCLCQALVWERTTSLVVLVV